MNMGSATVGEIAVLIALFLLLFGAVYGLIYLELKFGDCPIWVQAILRTVAWVLLVFLAAYAVAAFEVLDLLL